MWIKVDFFGSVYLVASDWEVTMYKHIVVAVDFDEAHVKWSHHFGQVCSGFKVYRV
jgi:hypothetical protein